MKSDFESNFRSIGKIGQNCEEAIRVYLDEIFNLMCLRSVRAHVSNTNSIVTKTRTPTLEHRYWDDAMEQVLKLAENICVELKSSSTRTFINCFRTYCSCVKFEI